MTSQRSAEGPSRIDAAIVAGLFDNLAEEYDRLCREKEYPGPSLAHELIRENLGDQSLNLSVLDIGCGTGLLGPVLRPLARKLVGVDLSEKMLDKAYDTGLYDLLEHADAQEYLGQHPGEFDIVVAMGVFHYFGELTSLLQNCLASLQCQGILLFTVASGPLMGDSYYYQPEQYFTHAPQYLMEQLGQSGITGGVLRRIRWGAADRHDDYALAVAVQRPEKFKD